MKFTVTIGGKKDGLKSFDDSRSTVFAIILEQMDKDNNDWYGLKGNKDYIKEKCGISPSTLDRIITELTVSTLLIKLDEKGRGVYKVNPKMYTFVGE